MTGEVFVLALSGLLQAIQYVIYAVPANLELGPRYTGGSRDFPPAKALSKRTARLGRALNNHFEGLILFGIAAIVVTLGQQSSTVTQTAAWVYFAARILYIPAYAFGWNPWRSAIWAIGFFATLTMIVASLI